LLHQFGGVVVLAGHQPWAKVKIPCPALVCVPLTLPDASERRRYWQNALDGVGVVLTPPEVDRLAEQFRLTPEQIEGALREALRPAMVSSATSREALTLGDLMAAARQQSGQELAALAQKLTPKYQWQDVVLPVDQTAHLREICHQARYREQVYGTWGFGDKLSRGKGLAMLFAGPPGTGKTMAAEVMANELQLDLYRIDLSQVVSKYIGETEKNLDRIFMAAQTANAILFFDEADALFGKRSDVKDAHDRYANIEVGYLLQKMEDYEGITILASNLRQNMDDAFVRRIQMIVEFPFPDEESRHRIWQVTFPPALPLAEDVDLAVLAREVKLPGGNIKNIALAAAFTAASEGGDMHMEHLIKAAQREHQKLGRRWSLS
jgi:SpoVK/Ycf46/Vps4 family AAA+-type ATPase